jgi:hypothetical protein
MKPPPSDKAIAPSEESDFREELGRLGFDHREFEVTYLRKRAEEGPGGVYRHGELVTVTRSLGRGSRTYTGGHGHAWVADAVDEVKAGGFGKK